jgi:cell division protein FtsW
VIRRVANTLILLVLVLVGLGLVMLASTSGVRGNTLYGDPAYFIKRQAIWVGAGTVAAFALSFFDYRRWRASAVPLVGVSLALLVAVLIPGVGMKVGGAYRWLRLGPMSFQPSEMAKLTVVVMLAAWMSWMGRRALDWRHGVAIPMAATAVFAGLLVKEPDIGTTALVGVVAIVIIFVGGSRWWHLAIPTGLGALGLVVRVASDPLRWKRVLAHFFPDQYQDVSYHVTQSKIAFIKGHWLGVGLGNSIQKHLYLPEAHTDFILAIIAEELGLAASLGVALMFIGVTVCGLVISYHAPDTFGRLLGFGITMLLSGQAAINIGVVTGVFPTKGLPLPFISYGGTSMMLSLACVGILLNIARYAQHETEEAQERPFKDRWQDF